MLSRPAGNSTFWFMIPSFQASFIGGVSIGRLFLARLSSCSRFCCWSWLRLIPSLSA